MIKININLKNFTDTACNKHPDVNLYNCQGECINCKYTEICADHLICGQCQLEHDTNNEKAYRDWYFANVPGWIKELKGLKSKKRFDSEDVDIKQNYILEEMYRHKMQYKQYATYPGGEIKVNGV